MKCELCDREVDSIFIVWGFGVVCSKACSRKARRRVKDDQQKLLEEAWDDMPEQLETADFERWTLKFAVHFLDALGESEREQFRENSPMLLVPDQFALAVKKAILEKLHPSYVSSVEHYGVERLFTAGTYCFRQPVPREIILEAAKQVELIE